MSSTVGIGLDPEYSGQEKVEFSWETNYGLFLGWNQSTGKIIEYGMTAVTPGTVYWSYSPDDTSLGKPSVTIRADAINVSDGRSEANSSVYIGWEDNTTAVVIAQPCGVTNCHGMNVTCGPDVAEICTMEYQIGDKCRAYANCRVQNGSCLVVEQPGYRPCVSCVENCIAMKGNDPIKAFECESAC